MAAIRGGGGGSRRAQRRRLVRETAVAWRRLATFGQPEEQFGHPDGLAIRMQRLLELVFSLC
ncbi:hypothetical protein [Oryza sativa Japonica Group]|uniref:Uncharacterized protein n=1 Tax=Oryza sativa subsp. japonica TaxID=39947 RepID=Q5ZBC8_ORYSJ|nr:hypothetical protein [Oryza sativa Japonica Group]